MTRCRSTHSTHARRLQCEKPADGHRDHKHGSWVWTSVRNNRYTVRLTLNTLKRQPEQEKA